MGVCGGGEYICGAGGGVTERDICMTYVCMNALLLPEDVENRQYTHGMASYLSCWDRYRWGGRGVERRRDMDGCVCV